jgi:hypothetical protein
MDNVPVDERYPSIYQRGGGGHAQPEKAPAPAPARVLTQAPETAVHSAPASTDRSALAPDVTGDVAPAGSRWPAKYPVVLAVAALLTVAAGVFCFAAQYLFPQSLTTDPTSFQGIQLPSWGFTVFYASQPIMTAGLGMACCFLLLASRQRPGTERWLRGCLWLLAALLIAAGMWALFAQNLFPRAMLSRYGSSGIEATPWTMALGYVCDALLIPGLASAAVLLILTPVSSPRRQPVYRAPASVDDEAESDSEPPLRKPVSWQAAWVAGSIYVILGAVFVFAPYLFPLSNGGETISTDTVSYSTTPWPQLLQLASSAFFLTGFAVIAWGLSVWARSGVKTRTSAVTRQP